MTKSERRRVAGVFREAAELIDGQRNRFSCWAIAHAEGYLTENYDLAPAVAVYCKIFDIYHGEPFFEPDNFDDEQQDIRRLALLFAAEFVAGGDHA